MFKVAQPNRFAKCTRCKHGVTNHLDSGCIVVNFQTNKYCDCKRFKNDIPKKN